MKVSIIVPVYNMAEGGKLNRCLDSLLSQTISDYEILVVDDASVDQSPDILRDYEKRYPDRVRVFIHEQNKRQGGARNTGLKEAKGEWVSFIDSDDWVRKDFYEKLLGKAEETGADLVGCDYSLVTDTVNPGQVIRNNTMEQTGVLDREKHKKLILRSGSMVIKIYRRCVIAENRLSFPEGIFYEDNCAGPLWSLYFTRFEKVEEPLYYYYQHDTSTVHAVTEEKCRDRMRSGELFYEECVKRGFLEEYRQEIEYRFSELYYCNTLFSYMQGMRNPRYPFIRELKEGMVKHFPDFQENVYYKEITGTEEQKLIRMQIKSDRMFYWYYRLKLLRRKLR